MHIKIDHHSGEPIWRQIVELFKFRIAAGQIQGDEQLPSIRALASDLKINPRTVVKAYEELEHAGLVVMRQGQGVFAAAKRSSAPAGTRRQILSEQARRLLAEASRLGADPEEVIEILKTISRELEKKSA